MLQLLRGTSEAVAASNPKLEAGQPFFELDTQKLKIGNGTSNYNDLLYIGGNSSSSSSCPFPVNAVMIFTVNQNPNSIWSETTWELFGQGKTLIGLDAGDTDYNTALKTGGAKTISLSHTHSTSGHALTTSEMPSHSHSFGSHNHSMNHSHSDTFSVSPGGSHLHDIKRCSTTYEGGTGSFRVLGWKTASVSGTGFTLSSPYFDQKSAGSGSDFGTITVTYDSEHLHSVEGETNRANAHTHSISGSVSSYSGSTGTASGSSGSAGSGSSHSHGNTGSALGSQSIVQSYITVCFWLRTA